MGTGYFLGVKRGRGVTLTPHPRLVPWSWNSTAIPLLSLRAVRPVQSLIACTRVHFTIYTVKLLSKLGGSVYKLWFSPMWPANHPTVMVNPLCPLSKKCWTHLIWQDSWERSVISWARSKVYYIVRMVMNPRLLGSVRRELLFLLMHFHCPWDLRVRRRWLDKIYVVVRRYIAFVFILRNYSE